MILIPWLGLYVPEAMRFYSFREKCVVYMCLANEVHLNRTERPPRGICSTVNEKCFHPQGSLSHFVSILSDPFGADDPFKESDPFKGASSDFFKKTTDLFASADPFSRKPTPPIKVIHVELLAELFNVLFSMVIYLQYVIFEYIYIEL